MSYRKTIFMEKKIKKIFMKKAIARAKQGIKKGQTPFGACVVLKDKLISCEHNKVWIKKDITAHAEILAIREACRRLRTIDLSGALIYSTCEPCPMCFSACHWAKVSTIIYGVSIDDAARLGFNELKVSNRSLKKAGKSTVKIFGGVLKKENESLFRFWFSKGFKRFY